MATTRFEDTSFSVSAIGNRTSATGTAVDDLSAEEARLINNLLNAGYLDTNAFVVAPTGGTMSVRVGSGTAKADHYVVPGTGAGQGNYLVRLDATFKTITIDAAATSGTRVDEIWLVVEDQTYEGNGRSLPRLVYRKGTVGGGNPGADAAWKARVLLARVTVTANKTSIVAGDINDRRAASAIKDSLLQGALARVTAVEDTYGAVKIGEISHTGGTNPTLSNISPIYKTIEMTGEFRFSDPGQFSATMRINGVTDEVYFSMAKTEFGNGTSQIDSNDGGINIQVGRFGANFSTVHARFTALAGANRIAAVGQGFGRSSAGPGGRMINSHGGYMVTSAAISSIRFNVGGPLTTDGTSVFRFYGYK
jgi:hypothetical protein